MSDKRSSQYLRFAVAQPLFWVHPTLDATLTDLQVLIYSNTGVLLETVEATSTSVLGVYSTEPWLAPTPGQYVLNWASVSGSIDENRYIVSTSYPYGDSDISIDQRLQHEFSASGYSAQLVIYDSDLVEVQTLDLVEFGTSKWYRTPNFLLEDEGPYLLVWRSSEVGPVEQDISIYYFGPRRGARACSFMLADNSSGTAVTLPYVDIVISHTDGIPILQTASSSEGTFSAVLKEATTYVVSLRLTNYIFSVNNFEITPGDPTTEGLNVFQLFTSKRSDSFCSPQVLSITEDLSLMHVDIVTLTGRPARGVGVLINNTYGVRAIVVADTSYGIVGGGTVIYTNAAGHAEVFLVRGATVEVTVEGTPIRRRFQVPDQDSFSLMSLITGTNDPFTIVQPNLFTASKSTL